MRTTALVKASVRKAQGCIPAQLGDQVQPTLADHIKCRIIAEMPIQGQVGRSQQTIDPHKQGLEHLLNALQLRSEDHSRLVFVLAPFRPARFVFWPGCFGFFGLLFDFTSRLFFFAAHRLLHVHWVGVPLVHTHQGKDKERQTGDHLLLQPREKMIQSIGLLPGFAGHTFITRQNVDLLFLKQGLAKELPQDLRPGNNRVVKTLDGAVAAACSSPP